MIDAVLFDWTNTLVQFTWDDDLLVEGHLAGLAAIGRADDPADFTARYRETVAASAGRDYAELLRELLGDFPDSEIDRFIDAEHEAWSPANQVLGAALALLEALRSRGIKTAVVANSWPDPARLLRADAAAYGLAPLLDAQIWSEEVGARKPEPEIFRRALEALAVDAAAAIFVGDRLDTDIRGAADVGLTTVQALWFHADEAGGVEPDYMAFTPMDVLNIVRRLGD